MYSTDADSSIFTIGALPNILKLRSECLSSRIKIMCGIFEYLLKVAINIFEIKETIVLQMKLEPAIS